MPVMDGRLHVMERIDHCITRHNLLISAKRAIHYRAHHRDTVIPADNVPSALAWASITLTCRHLEKGVEKQLALLNTGIKAAFGLSLCRDALHRDSHQPLPCICQLSVIQPAYRDFSCSLPPTLIYERSLEESGTSHLPTG